MGSAPERTARSTTQREQRWRRNGGIRDTRVHCRHRSLLGGSHRLTHRAGLVPDAWLTGRRYRAAMMWMLVVLMAAIGGGLVVSGWREAQRNRGY